jgi:hypothetical protein
MGINDRQKTRKFLEMRANIRRIPEYLKGH